jgi:hypothetical protein
MVPGEGCCVEFVSPMSRPFAADSTVSCDFAMVAAFLQNSYVVLSGARSCPWYYISIRGRKLLLRLSLFSLNCYPGQVPLGSAARVVPVVRAAS